MPSRSGKADEGRLLIAVEVRNLSATRKVDYVGWTRDGMAQVKDSTDNFSNVYRPKSVGRVSLAGQSPPMLIDPNKLGREVLAFEPPIEKAEFLRLELSAVAFGKDDVVRLKIPAKMIAERSDLIEPSGRKHPVLATPPKRRRRNRTCLCRTRPRATSASARTTRRRRPFGLAGRCCSCSSSAVQSLLVQFVSPAHICPEKNEEEAMSDDISRRVFWRARAGAASLSILGAMTERALAENISPAPGKVRIGKVYFGVPHPGWPMATVDVEAERKRVEAELTRLQPALSDVEFIDCGLVVGDADLARAKEKLQAADGILFLQLTMGANSFVRPRKLNVPTVLFAEPFCGHEWNTIAGALQRQGKRVDCWASSTFDDVVPAVRPFRAIRRLKDAKVLHVSLVPADPAYVKNIKDKFGTEIKSLKLADLEAAYKAVDQQAAEAEAQRWVREAEKVVEPTPEDILRASRMRRPWSKWCGPNRQR